MDIPPGSMAEEDRWLVPIRMVQSWNYCPREAWYRFALGDDSYLNRQMERGLRVHETFDQARPEHDSGEVFRHLPVYAPVLGVQGVLDEVIIEDDLVTIVEVKATRMARFVWPGVQLQLAVQWLALCEHSDSARWLGPPLSQRVRLRVYFADSRRYRDATWTSTLEHSAREAIGQCRRIFSLETPPEGNVGPRCAPCQHYSMCLPDDMPILLEEATRMDRQEDDNTLHNRRACVCAQAGADVGHSCDGRGYSANST